MGGDLMNASKRWGKKLREEDKNGGKRQAFID